MAQPEPIKVELPKLPDVEIPLLETSRFNVGTAILTYVTNSLRVPISDEYSSLCTRLDELREGMRCLKELTSSNVHLYVDYFTLLPGLTQHLDTTNHGMNLQFRWKSTVFNLVNADLVFFGFNTVIGLLKCITRISIRALSDIQAVIDCLKPCKAIYEKLSTLYQDSFQPVLSSSLIQVIPKYIDAFWSFAILRTTMFKNASGVLQGQISNYYSDRLQKLEPSQDDLSVYFKVFAYAKMFEGYKNETIANVSVDKKYGFAIAYGTQGIELCPKPPKPAKKKSAPPTPSPLQTLLEPLKQQLEASVEYLKGENSRLYHQTIPKEVEVPLLKKLDPIKEFVWEPSAQPISFDASVSQVASSQLQTRINTINQQVSGAFNKIAQIRSLYPSEKVSEIDQKTSTLYSKRTLCLEERSKLSVLFRGRAGARHPELQQNFNDMQAYIDRAAESDLHYETTLAKAKSVVQNMASQIAYLDPIQAQLLQLQESFHVSSQQAVQGINSPDLNQVISANQYFSKIYDDTYAQLQNLTLQIDDIYAQVNQLSQITIQNFNAELERVSEGFDNGIKCYTDITANFATIESKLMS